MMTSSLGSLGTVREAYDVDFDYFGTMIRVNPDITDLALVDFIRESATFTEETPDAEVSASIDGMLASIVHPDDFVTFLKTARKNRQTMEDLTALSRELVEKVTQVPTKLPSISSGGQSTTRPNSAADSADQIKAEMEAAGRPDLALVVVQAQEHRSA